MDISGDVQPVLNDDSDLAFHITNALRDDASGPKVESGKSEAWLHSVVDSVIRYPLKTMSLYSQVPLVMDRNGADVYVSNTSLI
jgi:hypothetical protein